MSASENMTKVEAHFNDRANVARFAREVADRLAAVCRAWEDADYSAMDAELPTPDFFTDYPFAGDLDEIQAKVQAWAETLAAYAAQRPSL